MLIITFWFLLFLNCLLSHQREFIKIILFLAIFKLKLIAVIIIIFFFLLFLFSLSIFLLIFSLFLLIWRILFFLSYFLLFCSRLILMQFRYLSLGHHIFMTIILWRWNSLVLWLDQCLQILRILRVGHTEDYITNFNYIFIVANLLLIVSNFSNLISITTKFMDVLLSSSNPSSSSSLQFHQQAYNIQKGPFFGTEAHLNTKQECSQKQQIVIQQISEKQRQKSKSEKTQISQESKEQSKTTRCPELMNEQQQKNNMLSQIMFRECLKKVIDLHFSEESKPKLEEIEDNTLFKSWNIFYDSLVQKISLLEQINEDCQFEEQQSSLNQAIMYESSDQIGKQLSSNKLENLEHSILQKRHTCKKNSESRILKTPIIDLMDNVYPQNNNKKVSDFRLSHLQDSSFDFSKTHTVHEYDYPMLESLMKLNYAQTELTYLCQFKGWRVLFVQGVCKEQSYVIKPFSKTTNSKTISTRSTSKVPKFNCVTEVNAEIKGVYKKIYGRCEIANSKKEAKHISSLLCLYQLYQCIENLWYEYEAVKMEKPSLLQDYSADNLSIFSNAGIDTGSYCLMRKYLTNATAYEKHEEKGKFNFNGFLNKENERFLQNRQSDNCLLTEGKKNGREVNDAELNEYVKKLDAPKKQLYYFVAQNKNIFLVPEWHCGKKGTYFWQVEGCVKYEKNNEFVPIVYRSSDKSRKLAEKKIASKILFELYTLFPSLYHKYKEVKNLKNLC